MDTPNIRLFLIAPNVSAQMGGEAIKALQIFEQLHELLGDVTQITHGRNRAELQTHPLVADIKFVDDDFIDILLWRSIVLRAFMTPRFSFRAVKRAEGLACTRDGKHVIIHQTEPNSPVATRWTSTHFQNVFGPINGNIYYPRAFRKFESASARMRRLLHFPLQILNRLFWRGLQNADLILTAGGERTIGSLRVLGVPRERIYETLDCGIPSSLSKVAHIPSPKSLGRFIHFGRLVFHKGTALAIEAVAKAHPRVTLDIVGRGPELDRCKNLAKKLHLGNRIRFLDWYENRDDLINSFENYSGVVLPSIEDANGIVIQESMAVGLIPICLDWGGPQLLIDNGVSGYLVPPKGLDEITSEIAKCLDYLAEDLEAVKAMSARARQRASEWEWTKLANDWVNCYAQLAARADSAPIIPRSNTR